VDTKNRKGNATAEWAWGGDMSWNFSSFEEKKVVGKGLGWECRGGLVKTGHGIAKANFVEKPATQRTKGESIQGNLGK